MPQLTENILDTTCFFLRVPKNAQCPSLNIVLYSLISVDVVVHNSTFPFLFKTMSLNMDMKMIRSPKFSGVILFSSRSFWIFEEKIQCSGSWEIFRVELNRFSCKVDTCSVHFLVVVASALCIFPQQNTESKQMYTLAFVHFFACFSEQCESLPQFVGSRCISNAVCIFWCLLAPFNLEIVFREQFAPLFQSMSSDESFLSTSIPQNFFRISGHECAWGPKNERSRLLLPLCRDEPFRVFPKTPRPPTGLFVMVNSLDFLRGTHALGVRVCKILHTSLVIELLEHFQLLVSCTMFGVTEGTLGSGAGLCRCSAGWCGWCGRRCGCRCGLGGEGAWKSWVVQVLVGGVERTCVCGTEKGERERGEVVMGKKSRQKRNWKTGEWKLESGNWRVETGEWKPESGSCCITICIGFNCNIVLKVLRECWGFGDQGSKSEKWRVRSEWSVKWEVRREEMVQAQWKCMRRRFWWCRWSDSSPFYFGQWPTQAKLLDRHKFVQLGSCTFGWDLFWWPTNRHTESICAVHTLNVKPWRRKF